MAASNFVWTWQVAIVLRKISRNIVATLMDWFDYWTKPALVAKSRHAQRRLRLNNATVDDARLQLVLQERRRVQSARKDAAAVTKALDAAAEANIRAERERNKEVALQTGKTDRTIALLERSIERARVRGAEQLSDLENKHADDRDKEAEQNDWANQALELLAEYADDAGLGTACSGADSTGDTRIS